MNSITNLLGRWHMAAVVAIGLACHAAIGADAPQYPGARADGSAGPDAPRQASEWYQTPADARYDAANPVLPSDYPARRYSQADLIRSLVGLAEKDRLLSADVEHEFGMRFVDGFARGQPPLGTRLSSASGSPVLRSLNLSFVSRQTRSEFIAGAPHRRVTCVNAAAVARGFRASGWRLAVVHGHGHSGGDEHTLAKTVAGTERRIVIRPFPHDDDTSRSGACVDFVHYLFVGNGPAAADTLPSSRKAGATACPRTWSEDHRDELVCASTILAQASPATARDWSSVDPARQGYSREQSVAMLDPQVRQFLDGILRLYKEEGLFADRRQALQALGITRTTRRWSTESPLPGRHRHYFDTFAPDRVFARPGWSGEYAYRSHGADPETWHASIRVAIDRTQDCQNSRAIEGYLDLQLDPGIRQQVHPVPERLFRHEVDFAEPYAAPLSARTPMLILTMGKGCMTGLQLVRIFKFKEVDDARSHDQ